MKFFKSLFVHCSVRTNILSLESSNCLSCLWPVLYGLFIDQFLNSPITGWLSFFFLVQNHDLCWLPTRLSWVTFTFSVSKILLLLFFLQAYIYNIYIYSIFKVTFASSLYMFLKLYNFEDNYICNRNNLHINYGCFLFQLSDISYLHLGDSPETLISAGQIFRKRHWSQFTQTKPIFCWLQGDQSTDRQQTHYVFV